MKPVKKERVAFSLSEEPNQKTFANKEEKKVAKALGMRQTPNSGAKRFLPGDMFDPENLVDVKSTQGSQIIVTVDMLFKMEADAFTHGKNPVLVLRFPKARKLRYMSWILIPHGSI